MLVVKSSQFNRTASLPANIQIPLDPTEDQIFSFIRKAIGTMPIAPVARVAGGWVRDKLLRKQSKDIDITVEGTTGVEFANALRQYAIETEGPQQRIVSTVKDTEARPEQVKNLAVAFLRIFGQDVEILNVRGKETYKPGDRNPVNVDMNATPEEDAHRRDLTINALFYNLNTGRVEDFTGKGYDDLLTMTLRTPIDPVKTFVDDPLRALRVLRFHSRYPDSKIAPEIIQAMQNEEVQHQITRRLVNQSETGGIVPERTADELRKLMIGAQPEAALRIMYQTGLLQKMFNLPEQFHPLHMDQQSSFHSLPVIEHTLKVVKNVNDLAQEFDLPEQDRMFLNMASLFHDIGKLDPRSHKTKADGTRGYFGDPDNPESMTHEDSSAETWENFATALRLSDKEKTTVSSIVSGHMRPHAHVEGAESQASDKQLRRYIRKNPLWAMQYIHAMGDSMSKDTEPNPAAADPYRANYERLTALEPSVNTFGQKGSRNDLLNGNRIIEILGLDPKTGYIEFAKERIRDMQDENPGFTSQEAEAHLLNLQSQGEFNQYV